MAIRELFVEGYRSIRRLRMPLGAVNVIVGPNASGKTNLYRALYLLSAAASGRLARTVADEGGMPSALWAGERKKGPVQLRVEVQLDDFSYELVCGLPASSMWEGYQKPSRFVLDPQVKSERATVPDGKRRVPVLERENGTTWLRDGEGCRVAYPLSLRTAESALSQLRDPHRYPVVAAVREELASWRFYHHFRSDPAAPLRQPQVGIQTPVLAPDGVDLAAALQTVREIGDGEALDAAIDRAFPGSRLIIDSPDARFLVQMEMPGLHRPLRAEELSDGTLRYLCLLAALLSPRPPSLLALNEPETSLHPDLLEPLASLVVDAGRRSQIWITTHAESLARAIAQRSRTKPIGLAKLHGETRIVSDREESETDES